MIRRSRCAHVLAASIACAAFFPPLPSHAETTPNLLSNSGAETGTIFGWTPGGDSNPRADNGSFDPGISPLAGSYDFLGGSGSAGTLTQTITLNGFAPTLQQIDFDGNVTYSASLFERSLIVSPGAIPDGAGFSFSFAGANPTQYTSPEAQSVGSWQSVAKTGPVSSFQAHSLTYTIYFNRHTGTDLDAFVDAAQLTLSYPGSSWKGASSGNWSSPSLWNSGVPTAGAPALASFAGAPAHITFDGNYANASLSELYVDAPGLGMTLSQSSSTMAAEEEFIGNIAGGTYSQSGGNNNVGYLYLSYYPTGYGTYNISGGNLTVAGPLFDGGSGMGTLSVSGTASVQAYNLVVSSTASTAAFSLSGGNVTVTNLTLGDSQSGGTGNLSISGGSLTVNGTLLFSSFFDPLTFSSGNLTLAAVDTHGNFPSFQWTGGTLKFLNDFSTDFLSLLGNTISINQNQSLIVNGLATIGNNANASLTQQGGAVSFAQFHLGANPGITGSINVANPSANFSAIDAYIGGTPAGPVGIGILNISAGAVSIQHLTLFPGSNVNLSGGTLAVSSFSAAPGAFNWTSGTLQFLSDQTVDSSFLLGNSIQLSAGKSLLFTSLSNNGSISGDPTSTLSAASLHNEFTGNITTSGKLLLTSSATSTNIGTLNVSGPFQTAGSLVNFARLTLSGPQSWATGTTFTNNAGSATFASTAEIYGLTINGGSVDITSAKLIDQTTPATKSAALSTLATYLASHALNSSSLPAHTTLAVIDNGSLPTPFTTFGGLPVDANSLLITPALLGDANFDGTVTLADLNILLSHFGQQTYEWTFGNFDNAPTINLTDLSYVLNNFGLTIATPTISATTPAPEPLTLAWILLPAVWSSAFRRRRGGGTPMRSEA